MNDPVRNPLATRPQNPPAAHHQIPPASPHQKHEKHEEHEKREKAMKARALLKRQEGFQEREGFHLTRRFLAGYVVNRETADRLGCVIRGIDPASSPPTKRPSYWPPNRFEATLRKDLPFQGEDTIAVHWIGEISNLDTIFATHKSYDYNGPPKPEIVEGEKEKVIRGWLESKGMCHPPYVPPLHGILTPSAGVRKDEYQWRVIVDDV